jgi:apolipoprotein N-acyltransferase
MVCYESPFESLARHYRAAGADFLVNITNDAWFGRTAAPYQHASHLVLRAIETRMGIARAANDGISAVIGPHGEVVARAPEFRPVVLVSKVTPMAGLTHYERVGNWLILTLAALALACGIGVRNDRLWRTRSGSSGASN